MEYLLTLVSELTAENYIDVPFAPGVDPAGLVEGDNDPVFVTLPIAKAGVVSRNNRPFSLKAVERIVEQVNKLKPGGIKGHMTLEERASRFDLPVLMWVGAKMQGDTAYGKAYIPTYATDVREYVKKQKARRAPVATSVYGMAKGGNLELMDLEEIDLADPPRAGVPEVGAVPQLTSEMKEDSDMGENQELITELRDQRKAAETERDAAKQTISELNAKIAEMEKVTGVVAEIAPLFGEGANVVQEVRELITENKALKRATLISDIRAYVDSLEQAKVPQAKALILEHLGISESGVIAEMVSGDLDAAKAKADAYVTAKADLIKALTVAEMGPGALVGGKDNRVSGKSKLDDSDEAKRRAAGLYGFTG